MLFRSILSLAQSLSTGPRTTLRACNCGSKNCSKWAVVFKYRTTRLMRTKSPFVGFDIPREHSLAAYCTSTRSKATNINLPQTVRYNLAPASSKASSPSTLVSVLTPGVGTAVVRPDKPNNSAMLAMRAGLHLIEKPVAILVMNLPRYFSVWPSDM